MHTTSEIAAAHTSKPTHCSFTPNSPTVVDRMNAPRVLAPKPAARKPGTQCFQASSSIAMTRPATALNMKAGPIMSMSLKPSSHSLRCTYADTSAATAVTIRVTMSVSLRRSGAARATAQGPYPSSRNTGADGSPRDPTGRPPC